MEQIAKFMVLAVLWVWSAAFMLIITYVGIRLLNETINKKNR